MYCINNRIYFVSTTAELTSAIADITTNTSNGRIIILTMDDVPVDFDVEKSQLDLHDRYRHLLTLSVSISQVEE